MTLNKKQVLKLSATIFGAAALVHLLRLVYGWTANIGGFDVPVWLSGVAVIVAGYLASQLWKMA